MIISKRYTVTPILDARQMFIDHIPGYGEQYASLTINLDGTANAWVIFENLARWWKSTYHTASPQNWDNANALIVRFLNEYAEADSGTYEASAVDSFFEELAEEPEAFERFISRNDLSHSVRDSASWYTPRRR